MLTRIGEGIQPTLQDVVLLKSATPGALADSARELALLGRGFRIATEDTLQGSTLLYWWRGPDTEGAGPFEVELFGHEFLATIAEDRFAALDNMHVVLDTFAEAATGSERDSYAGPSQRLYDLLVAYGLVRTVSETLDWEGPT